MILFLDDNKDRTKRFRSEVPRASTVETAAAMIALLKKCHEDKNVVEMLFLDHDLGDQTYVDSSLPDTGMEVVRWIEANKPEIDQIVVHSCNHPAAKRMEDALKNLGYNVLRIPFPSLKFQGID